MYYIYILLSEKDRNLYVGFAKDLRSRIEKHNKGYVRATKHRRPLHFLYYECYSDLVDAKKREKYLKGGKGRAELKIQLCETLLKNHYKHL